MSSATGRKPSKEAALARRAGWLTPDAANETGIPSWAQLPAPRRRRLVAVLGDLVLRERARRGGGNES